MVQHNGINFYDVSEFRALASDKYAGNEEEESGISFRLNTMSKIILTIGALIFLITLLNK